MVILSNENELLSKIEYKNFVINFASQKFLKK